MFTANEYKLRLIDAFVQTLLVCDLFEMRWNVFFHISPVFEISLYTLNTSNIVAHNRHVQFISSQNVFIDMNRTFA